MKSLLLLILITATGALAWGDSTPEDNSYFCRLFQPSPQGGVINEVRVDPKNTSATVELLDGVHFVQVNWWSWISEVQVFKKGQVVEVVGAASHEQIKLRSHKPRVSIHCHREDN